MNDISVTATIYCNQTHPYVISTCNVVVMSKLFVMWLVLIYG